MASHHNVYESDEVFRFIIERIKHPQNDLSFLNPAHTDARAWGEKTRAFVREKLLYDPPAVDFQAQVLEEEDFGSYVRQKIVYYTAPHCRVSAYLLVPKQKLPKAPAILALHDHSGRYYWGKEKIVDHHEELPMIGWFQRFRYGGRGYASQLAKMGYVVLCPDALGWGDRCSYTESWAGPNFIDMSRYTEGTEEYVRAFDEAWGPCQNKLEEAIEYAGLTYMGVIIMDDLRSLDYLCSLPFVDQARVGCVGLSMGGHRAAMVGALDERIACSCVAGYMTRYRDIAPNHTPPNAWAIPGVYNRIEFPDLVALTLPRKLLILNCENDKLFDLSTIESASQAVRDAYNKAGAPENCTVRGFALGHQFGLEMQNCAFDWFEENL